MAGREKAVVGGWQAWVRDVAGKAATTPVGAARGARIAEPVRNAWRAHLAGVAALRS